jgi:hypothetical protein
MQGFLVLAGIILAFSFFSMGNRHSIPFSDPLDHRPQSILKCLNVNGDGQGVDPGKYIQYRQRRDEEMAKLALFVRNNNKRQEASEQDAAQGPPEKKRRNRNKSVLEYDDEERTLCPVLPTESPWYIQYVRNPAFGNEFLKKFRRRFRLPYKQYKELVEDARVSGYFDRWLTKDALNKQSSPLELLILGALRYLGRGWTFERTQYPIWFWFCLADKGRPQTVALLLSFLTFQVDGFAISPSKSSKKKLMTNDRKGSGGGGFGAKTNVVPRTHTPDTSPTTQTLVKFLQSQKSKGLNDGTEIGYDTSTNLRGVYATRPFKKGEILCRIPSDCALTLSDPALGGSDVPTIAHAARNFLVMYQNDEQAKVTWKPYVPTRDLLFDPTPDFYSEDELEQMEFPRAIERARQRRQEIEELAATEKMSVEELQFANWLVSSRSFSIQFTAGDATSGAVAANVQKSVRVLLPYLDMMNHSSNQPNAELHLIDPEMDEAWFAIQATRNIPEGKEVCICYGSGVNSSVEIMGDYGFVPTDNKFDALMLKKGGEGCIEHVSGWKTTLEDDLAALETAEGNMRIILALRIKLKQAYADISKK